MFRIMLLACCWLMLSHSAASAQKKKTEQKQPEPMLSAAPGILREPLDEHNPEAWKRSAIDDGRLSILLPGKLVPYLDPDDKTPYTARYGVSGQNAFFEVDYLTYPMGLETPTGMRAALNRQRNLLLSVRKTVNLHEHDILIQGRPGKALTWTEPMFGSSDTLRVEMFVDRDRLYFLKVRVSLLDQATAGKKQEAFRAAIAQKFFRSVTLGDTPAPIR